MKPKILVVDDEPDAIDLLRVTLQAAGFDVYEAEDGAKAVARARELIPDCMILDLMLPEIDGLEVCKILRRQEATREIPIIILTAKTEEIDKLLGLELGADDYMTKPFSSRELVLRIRAVLRRRATAPTSVEEIRIGPLLVDVPRHLVMLNQERVNLTLTEFKLLTVLLERRGRVQSREQLLQDVWEYDTAIDTRTIDTHVRRLREKLGCAAKFLDTVRGVGYRFLED